MSTTAAPMGYLRRVDAPPGSPAAARLDAQDRAMPGLRAVYDGLPSGRVNVRDQLATVPDDQRGRYLRALDSLSALGLVIVEPAEEA